jgi:hypothetical protein
LANLGFRQLQKRTAAKGATNWFALAISNSSSFALAESGESCALFALGHYDQAAAVLNHSVTNFGCDLPYVHKLALTMDEYINGNSNEQLAKLSEHDIGTTMERMFTDLIRACHSTDNPFKAAAVQRSFNSFNSAVNTLPKPEQDRWSDRFASLVKSDPVARASLPMAVANSAFWNAKGGAADMWNANINRSITVEQSAKVSFGQASFEGARSVTLSSSPQLQQRLDIQTRQNYDFANQLSHKFETVTHLPNPINGVTTQAANTYIEDPQAYFSPGYGLLYAAEPKEKQ